MVVGGYLKFKCDGGCYGDGSGAGGKVNVLVATAAMCDHWKPHRQQHIVSLTRQQTVRCPFGRASLFLKHIYIYICNLRVQTRVFVCVCALC